MVNNAGGHFVFKPTADSTKYVRAAIEGKLNGFYDVDVEKAEAVNGELAGLFCTITADGKVAPASAKGVDAVGLIRDDLVDMVNASGKASFYFVGGEYHVAESRLGGAINTFTIGGGITTDANGKIVPATDGDTVLGVVTATDDFPMGNMYEWAGSDLNGGKFLGFIMKM